MNVDLSIDARFLDGRLILRHLQITPAPAKIIEWLQGLGTYHGMKPFHRHPEVQTEPDDLGLHPKK